MRVICIDPGHGGEDPGCTNNGIIESDYVYDFATTLSADLINLGNATTITRMVDERMGLARRAQIASSVFADLSIILHVNSGNENEHGPIAFRLFGIGMSAAFCDRFDELCRVKIGGEYADGEKIRKMKSHFTIARPIDTHWTYRAFNVICHHSSRPAVLIELGYSSNKKEAEELKTFERKKMMRDIICESVKYAFEG